MLSATPVGSEVRVNTFTAGARRTNHSGTGGSMAMDADGDFVVTWSSNGQDGSSYGVYAQRYQVVAFTVNGTVLNVQRTSQNDTITVRNIGGTILIDTNGTSMNTGLAAASVTGVVVSGMAGNDNLKLHSSLGASVAGTLNGGLGSDTLDGGAGNDTLIGEAGNDILTGREGADSLDGGADNDQLNGGAGADTLFGGNLNDKLTGGLGIDTVSYAFASAAVSVNLANKKATGGAGIDTLTTIENVIGSAFADTITGNSGNNILDGGAGVDTIIGGGGVDTILNA